LIGNRQIFIFYKHILTIEIYGRTQPDQQILY